MSSATERKKGEIRFSRRKKREIQDMEGYGG